MTVKIKKVLGSFIFNGSKIFYKYQQKETIILGKKESDFQGNLIKEIKERFPGCIVMKNDSGYLQGVPDLTVLYGNKWATLEDKREQKAHHQPNQDWYVEKMNNMSFSAFIYPENKEEVLNEMERSFQDIR